MRPQRQHSRSTTRLPEIHTSPIASRTLEVSSRTSRVSWRVGAVCAATVCALSAGTFGAKATDRVIVIGEKALFVDGTGWGTPHPSRLFNGGDPNGLAWRLVWKDWGKATATAKGLTWIPRSTGGYYRSAGTVELRASAIGRCRLGGPIAYLRLEARESIAPGSHLGPWFRWAGLARLCRPR